MEKNIANRRKLEIKVWAMTETPSVVLNWVESYDADIDAERMAQVIRALFPPPLRQLKED